ncbi:calcium/sodium antiporter [Echinimonas agarilytica]|uniref:Calcium/sodium antiporter n=1 Tax=Echinimonas agarilytica TaxID=1215918 RepID=A0AA41W514_9GAMM|nr:calcium/sodium antiporter [Echinimonas agarilytica]MCM2678617.1 calcium/sodium antiporter [Echinimonas agarilytica]
MLLATAMIIIGLILLGWSADRLVYGSASIARNFGISPLIIGMTIIAMGSSAPEMMVSATASFMGRPDTAVGNVLGSNITNIALVLGVTLLFKSLSISSTILRREIPLLIIVTGLSGWILHDAYLSFVEGIILLLGFIGLLGALLRLGMTSRGDDPLVQEQASEVPDDVPTGKAILWTIVGLIVLPISAHILVTGSTEVARALGMSDLVIGLTILAIGTSLPELAASIAAVRKGEDDMVIGNIVGSNLFNILAVLGIAGTIAPAELDPAASGRDLYSMLGITGLLVVVSYAAAKAKVLGRWFGFILLAAFIAYEILLYTSEVNV